MPNVKCKERYCTIAYEVCCDVDAVLFLIEDLKSRFAKDRRFRGVENETRLWDGDRKSCVVVLYDTVADAVRLDAEVRKVLTGTPARMREIMEALREEQRNEARAMADRDRRRAW
jgi:hypothetical protein